MMFSVMIVPEIWKNRRFSAVEIEKTAFYSLRQICAARTLLFAAVDLVMITAFFSISVYTLQISAYRIIIDFLVPLNVSCCICFRLLYSKWNDMEHIAVFLSISCILICVHRFYLSENFGTDLGWLADHIVWLSDLLCSQIAM